MHVTVQVAVAAIIALVATVITNTAIVVGQATTAITDGNDALVELIPATALTGTSGALVWVVRQIVSGKLVHRDPASDAEENRKALEASTKALVASTRVIEQLTHHQFNAHRQQT